MIPPFWLASILAPSVTTERIRNEISIGVLYFCLLFCSLNVCSLHRKVISLFLILPRHANIVRKIFKELGKKD